MRSGSPIFLALALLAPLFAAATGCAPEEHAILLRLRAQVPVERLSVRVSSLEGRGPTQEERNLSVRDPDDIRVLVRLESAAIVAVHVTGRTSAGGVLVATRCYDVEGTIEDDAILAGPLGDQDFDEDTFPVDASAFCLEPDGDGGERPCRDSDLHLCDVSRAQDCDDMQMLYFPGAPTQCADGIDQDCDGEDEPCADDDGDGSNACPPGEDESCDCDDTDPAINPGAEEPADGVDADGDPVCNNGVDEDCDTFDTCCDADGDGTPLCRVCVAMGDVPADRVGMRCINDASCSPEEMIIPGSCSSDGPGSGDCDDTDPSVFPGAPETCDGVDNNCNGLVDELSECRGPNFDNDGAFLCGHPMTPDGAPCESEETECDSGLDPTAREICGDGFDNDLDSMTDEGCPAGDMDNDGQVSPQDCDDMNPLAYDRTGAPGFVLPDIDTCGDGFPNNCEAGGDRPCSEDTDGDGYVERVPASCEGDASRNPDAAEVCDGVDNDCDGITDEVLDPTMRTGCAEGSPIDFFGSDFLNCGGCRLACDPDEADQCVMGVCDCQSEAGTGGCIAILTMRNGSAPVRPVCDAACGGCADLDSDPNNCGGCGNRCGDDETCMGGVCRCGSTAAPSPGVEACAGGNLECCSGACVNVTQDEGNCGSCGHQCGPNTVCEGRVCRCDPATPQFLDCDGNVAANGGNGCEVDVTAINDDHCGMCGNPCGTDAHCVNDAGSLYCECNSQRLDCAAGRPWCETMFTTANCGACGMSCGAMESCTPAGECQCGSTTAAPGTGRACGTNESCCSGTCRNLNQTSNCGACGVSCGPMETCASGSCRCDGQSGTGGVGGGPRCTGGTTCCPSAGCRDTANDVNHCGGCGNSCPTPPNSTRTCSGSTCGYTCLANFADCDGLASNGCEVDVRTNVSHCGGCGNSCPSRANALPTCAARTCGFTCTSGYGNCDGMAVNGCESLLASDPANCGGCGNSCPTPANSTRTCAASSCGFTCNGTFDDCDGMAVNGCEADLATDVSNCGGCGNGCPMPSNTVASCSSMTCNTTCVGGFDDCDAMSGNGCEADLGSVATCLDCGTSCVAGPGAVASCGVSGCEYTCMPGRFDCDADPTDCEVTEDDSNCGGCGMACVSGASCVSSACLCGGSGGDQCFDGVEGDRCSGATCRCGSGGAACTSPDVCTSGTCG